MRSLGVLLSILTAALLMWGCAHEERAPAVTPAVTPMAAPAEFPLNWYQQAAAQGRPVYRVVAAESLLSIVVRRGGPLAKLGHDHVVSSTGVQGYADPQQSRADLYLLLDALVVDDPALRAQAGLDTQPSASDIAATRSNMLVTLAVQQYPYVQVRVNGTAQQSLNLDITLHGVTRNFPQVPATLDMTGELLTVTGRFAINQSDFGITPFSVLGGAIRVEDRLELAFRIHAGRMRP